MYKIDMKYNPETKAEVIEQCFLFANLRNNKKTFRMLRSRYFLFHHCTEKKTIFFLVRLTKIAQVLYVDKLIR